MAGGESLMIPYLNQSVLGGKSVPFNENALLALLAGDEHNVPGPGGKELEGSQNLWKLKAACLYHKKMAPPYTTHDLVARLRRERDEIGLWGSEGTSPVYHLFMLTGELVCWMYCDNPELKDLLIDSTASFMYYAKRMGLDKSPHGLVGQRGASLDHSEGYPYLHFLLQYMIKGQPADYASLPGWKRWFRESGLVVSAVSNPLAKRFWELVMARIQAPGFTPWRLRAKTTVLFTPGEHLCNVVEKGINGNTPLLAAYARRPHVYLPVNYATHIRQQADHARCTYSFDLSTGMITLKYTGLYADIAGQSEQAVSFGPVDLSQVMVFESSLDGVKEYPLVAPAPPAPPSPPLPPKPPHPPKPSKPTWIERMGL